MYKIYIFNISRTIFVFNLIFYINIFFYKKPFLCFSWNDFNITFQILILINATTIIITIIVLTTITLGWWWWWSFITTIIISINYFITIFIFFYSIFIIFWFFIFVCFLWRIWDSRIISKFFNRNKFDRQFTFSIVINIATVTLYHLMFCM